MLRPQRFVAAAGGHRCSTQPISQTAYIEASRSTEISGRSNGTTPISSVLTATTMPNSPPAIQPTILRPRAANCAGSRSFSRTRTPTTTVLPRRRCARRPARTNASSRLPSPRTSATVPAATTRPLVITATWPHSCSTSAITWLESTTAPPEATNRLQDGADGRGGDRVHRLERLVQHQQPRRVQQRHRQADLLAHAGGVVDHQRALGVGQFQHAEQFVGALGDRRRASPRSSPM